MDPRRVFVAGDIHGNPAHAEYLFNEAVGHNAEAIVQVGDCGYWEHTEGGVVFMNLLAELVASSGVRFYFIDGNHESHTLLRSRYGPGGDKHNPTPEGFWTIRPGVYYVPRGTRWEWNDVRMMGLGGAYSVDKDWRLQIEQYGGMQRNGRHGPPTGPRTQWWPEEELTDEEVDAALARSDERLDILFTHDRPRAAHPPWDRKDLLECQPNQDRIQRVIKALRPRLVVHGHLHLRYQDQIRSDGDSWTTVIGLDCDNERNLYELLNDDETDQAVRDQVLQILRRSWTLIDLDPGPDTTNQ
jgi:hypothetical protein